MNTPIKWNVDSMSLRVPEVALRNDHASVISDLDVSQICYRSLSISLEDLKLLFRHIVNLLGDEALTGTGIEIGAGTSLLSSVAISHYSAIECIYAVEIVESYATLVMPKVGRHILGGDAGKVMPVIGSFDNIELESKSLDFCLEIHSLHHSHDIETTLREVNRVLKSNAKLVCVDRSQPNSMTEEDREQMLDCLYDKEFLEKNGYPPGISLSRRDNGEHEIKVSEWEEALYRTGFIIEKKHFLNRPFSLKNALFHLGFLLPAGIGKHLYGERKFLKVKRMNFDRELSKFAFNSSLFVRDYTIFICRKL